MYVYELMTSSPASLPSVAREMIKKSQETLYALDVLEIVKVYIAVAPVPRYGGDGGDKYS